MAAQLYTPAGQSGKTTMSSSLNESIASYLLQRGWTAFGGTAIAIKGYPTAVGEKEAAAYVVDYGRNCDGVLLTGTYWSEGRNVLEPHAVLIPKTVDEASLREYVKRFVAQCDAVIADTYAARLLTLPEQGPPSNRSP